MIFLEELRMDDLLKIGVCLPLVLEVLGFTYSTIPMITALKRQRQEDNLGSRGN